MTPQIPHILRYFTVKPTAVPPIPQKCCARRCKSGAFLWLIPPKIHGGLLGHSQLLILECVPALKERLLEKLPGEFRYRVRYESRQQRNERGPAIGDRGERVQQKHVAKKIDGRVNDIDAIRNAAQLPQKSQPHERR